MTKNVALIYTRVSSERQVDNKSLGEQERICKNFVVGREWKTDRVFVEEGESAKSADRTQLNKMLEYCQANKKTVGHVVVYKLDRFARSVTDHTALRAVLKKMDIMLWSATEPIDDSTTGTLMENVLASFAQFDNQVRSERSRGGSVARAKDGCWVNQAPAGYINVKNATKQPTLTFASESEVKAVRRFFTEFATGKYRQSDAIALAKKCGVKTKKGNYLSKTGVIHMLNNVVYIGKVKTKLTDNEIIDGIHPSMISEELFQRVQDILNGRRRTLATPAKRVNKLWPLRRYLICGQCNAKLTGSSPKGRSSSYAYYHCTKCTKKRTGTYVKIPKDKAHEDFEQHLASLVPSEWALKVFKEIVIRRWNNDFREVQEMRRGIDQQLKKLEDQKNELFDRWMDGRIKSDEDYDAQNQRFAVRKADLEFERSQLKDDELDKESVVDKAVQFMSHVSDIWKLAPITDKMRFQNLVYEAGLYLNPDQTFGTTTLSPIFQQITELETYFQNNKKELSKEKFSMVQGEGFEPPKANASRFTVCRV